MPSKFSDCDLWPFRQGKNHNRVPSAKAAIAARQCSSHSLRSDALTSQGLLLHHSHAMTIRGDSYRLRAKRRSRLLHKTTSTNIDNQPPIGDALLGRWVSSKSDQCVA